VALSVEPKALADDALLVLVKNATAKRRQIAISLSTGKNVKSVKVTLQPNSEQIVSVPLPQLGRWRTSRHSNSERGGDGCV